MVGLRKIDNSYLNSPDASERKVLEEWRRKQVFRASLQWREQAPGFVFFEGPPTANGKPGIHHVFARTIKDVIPRYQTMCGKQVVRKAGWDTHGLPVELEVEKKLKISGKKAIESLKDTVFDSIAEFNRLCRESIFTYKKDWEELSDRIGYWLDYADPYITCSNDYMESVWYLLSRFYANDLLYEGHRVLPFCTRCGTTLSSHELGQPGAYRDVQDPSVYIRFPLKGQPDTAFLVWTTTPWTLPSNVALALHPQLEYVKIQQPGEKLILVAARAAALFPDAEILERIPGKKLVGTAYEPLFDQPIEKFALQDSAWQSSKQHVFTVRAGEFVSAEEGTGIVHMAPAYGADDYALAKRDGLPVITSVKADGLLQEIWPGFPKGLFFKEADKLIVDELKQRNRLLRRETVQHNYPFCWRCDTPLMYFATPAWFIRTTAYKDKLIELNKTIHWEPAEVGKGRFGEWLENNIDWTLSRERYWGTPLPIWQCTSCKAQICIDGREKLCQLSTQAVPEDLHRPYIDQVSLRCEKCTGSMLRVPYVIDCWFDSGAMPYAQYSWPFTAESLKLLQEQFPAHFIAEGLDQTRGWFYTLHAIATFLTAVDRKREFPLGAQAESQSSAYKSCIVNGLLLDKDGRKMSKRLGNVVDPWQAIQKDGADAIRWYLLSSGAPYLDKRYDAAALSDVRRRFFGTLTNSMNFFVLYANIDKYSPTDKRTALAQRPLIDRWLCSRFQSLVEDVRNALDNLQLQEPVRRLERFVIDELSNWYIRRNRRRFWKGGGTQDLSKRFAYDTLYEVLLGLTKLLAPFTPFYAEMLWQGLGADPTTSVHLQDYPLTDKKQIDTALEKSMQEVLSVVEMGRVVRERLNLRVRQPLAAIKILGAQALQGEEFLSQIRDELNVKAVQLGKSATLKAKPNFPVLGKRAGKLMKALQTEIANLPSQALADLRQGKAHMVQVAGETFELQPDDVQVLVEGLDGPATHSDGMLAIAFDTQLTEELVLEGTARELVNRIQNLRKAMGLEVVDRIRLELDPSVPPPILQAIKTFGDYIADETLAAGGLHIAKLQAANSHEVDLGKQGKILLRLERHQA